MKAMQRVKRFLFFIVAISLILLIIGCTYESETSTNSQSAQISESDIADSESNSDSEYVSDENSQSQSIDPESLAQSLAESIESSVTSETTSKPFVKKDGILYLTFDDGPHPKNTAKVLDILMKYNVKATFFIVGDWAKKYPGLIKRIDSEGHAIACHTMTHKTNVIYKSVANLEADLNEWESTIKDILGELPESLLYRFPEGSTASNKYGIGKELVQYIKDRNYTVYDWNASNGDRWPGGKKENETTDEYLRRLMIETIHWSDHSKEPCVVLLHDSANETLDMLEWSIETLIEEGYQFDNLYGLNHSVVFKMS